jgi:hypothetical protein
VLKSSQGEEPGLTDEEVAKILRQAGQRAIREVSDDLGQVAPFPLQVFPAKLQEYLKDAAGRLPCPVDYIGMPVLVVVGSFIGNERPLQVREDWEELPLINGVLVAGPGTRKSPAVDLALAPAREHDRNLEDDYKQALTVYEAEKRACQANKEPFTKDPPIPRQHIAVDTTVESLGEVLERNPRGLLIHRDEATGWVASLNQYRGGKGADRQFWLSAWSSQDYTINRKGKPPIRLRRVFVPFLGCTPPDMVPELADRQGREDGFIDRILFAYPEPVEVKWVDADPNPALKKAYINACLRIGRLPPATLRFSRDALVEYIGWFDDHNRDKSGPAGSWAKLDGYCARLASILHHLKWAYRGEAEDELEVGVTSVRGAIKLIDYFKNHVRRCLRTIQAGKDSKLLGRLLALVRNSDKHRVRPRGLILAKMASTADEAKGLLAELVDMGLGTFVKGRRADEVIFQGREDLEAILRKFEAP